jgi:hypothetical protein
MPTPTGRLMMNTSRQSTVVSSPPSGCPTSPATAPPTAQTPSARARRRLSGKVSRISAIEAGSRTAAPAPWTQRAATSAPIPGPAAQAADASVNVTMPSPSAFFAPIRSARLPANNSMAANSRVYPSIVHCWPEVPPPSSRVMFGSATFTIEMSRVIRKNPSDPTARTVRACGASGAGAEASATGNGGLVLDKVGLSVRASAGCRMSRHLPARRRTLARRRREHVHEPSRNARSQAGRQRAHHLARARHRRGL